MSDTGRMSLGRALADTFDNFGIRGYIVGCDADDREITVWRLVQTHDGRSVALFEDPITGDAYEVCRVAETFDLAGPW